MGNDDIKNEDTTCLVIGGGGFLGRHIVESLLEKHYRVRVFDMRQTFTQEGVQFFIGNLCETKDLLPAMEGVTTIFHCATPSPLSNNKALFYKVNYGGTQTIISAAKTAGVKRLVLTSTASCVYEGKDIVNGTESLPYSPKPLDYYTETKILQEKLVLAADCDALQTVAIRPHGIFGPRDVHMLPTTAKMAASGKTKFIIGDGKNIVDFTYVANVVHGHILASEHLTADSTLRGKASYKAMMTILFVSYGILLYRTPSIASEAYNITNDEPIFFWTFLTRMITGLGYPAPYIYMPYQLMVIIAAIMQFAAYVLSPIVEFTPSLSPMKVALAGTAHSYSCERAKKDFGYAPIVSLDEAIVTTLSSFPKLHRKN